MNDKCTVCGRSFGEMDDEPEECEDCGYYNCSDCGCSCNQEE